jgi:glycosyltransferase involved in cell wall biosynthesis
MPVNSKIKVAILTNVIPSYREGFYNRLFSTPNLEVKVFCQEKVPGFNYNTIHHKYPKNVYLVKFIALKNEKLVWQFLPFIKIIKEFDVIFVDGNPRILSHFLLATFLRLLNKKVVVWSMVHSFRNNNFTEGIRIAWLKMFKNHFLYNDHDIELLKQNGFEDKKMLAMNNGLDQENIDGVISSWNNEKIISWKKENGLQDKVCIVSCGRLEFNKYEDMVEAMPKVIEKIPNIMWFVIGDGSAKESLKNRAIELKVDNHINFVGALYKDEEMVSWFLSSELFVHPAPIGLSIMHAFGYGLPVVTYDKKEEHGPEYIAFEKDKTGVNYEKNNVEDLANKVVFLLNHPILLTTMREHIFGVVHKKYNTQIMKDRFVEMVESVYK